MAPARGCWRLWEADNAQEATVLRGNRLRQSKRAILAPRDAVHHGSESIQILRHFEALGKFQRVCLRYRPELPYALNNVTFETQPAEKLGIVGE